MNFIATLLTPFVALGVMIGSLFIDQPDKNIGASEAIPTTIAFFETTLASAISSTATSFTLTSATDKDGTTLASSTYAFVIDEGSSNEEIVIADCTATACTNALRGVSARTGNTEVTALKKSHRRGASVKMTDAPILPLVARALRGDAVVNFTPDSNYDIATKAYVDSLSLGSTTVSASYSDDGIAELATGVEAASSTATGGSGSPLVLHTGISTSTAPSTGSYVVVTGADGNIADGFIGDLASTTDVKVGGTPILSIGSWVFATTTEGTSTWSVPSGIQRIKVTLVGPGRNGANGTGGVSGGGGGAGGACIKWYNVSATSTIQYHVGEYNTGEYSWFGGSYSSPVMKANPGGAGDATGNGGTGGSATGCDLNFDGGDGGGVTTASTDPGMGGNSIFGGAGANGDNVGNTSGGTAAGACGAGGGGGADGTGGGVGSDGCLIIEY